MKVLIIGISVPLVVLTIFAVAIGVFVRLRLNGKKLNVKKNMASQKKQNDLQIEKTLSRRVSLKAIMNGNINLPLVDEFDNLTTYDDSIGQRFTTAQGKRYNKVGCFNRIQTTYRLIIIELQ